MKEMERNEKAQVCNRSCTSKHPDDAEKRRTEAISLETYQALQGLRKASAKVPAVSRACDQPKAGNQPLERFLRLVTSGDASPIRLVPDPNNLEFK